MSVLDYTRGDFIEALERALEGDDVQHPVCRDGSSTLHEQRVADETQGSVIYMLETEKAGLYEPIVVKPTKAT